MKRFICSLLLAIALLSLAGKALADPSMASDKALGYCEAGNLFYGQKKYDQAIHYYESAIQADPKLWQAYQGEGSCYYARGEKAKSLPFYQMALNLNRNDLSLSAFVLNLRTQVDQAKAPTPQPTPAQIERETMLRQAYEISVDHFELSPALGAAFDDGLTGLGGGLSGFYMFDPQFGLGGILRLYLFGSSASGPFDYDVSPIGQGTGIVTYSGTVSSLELMPAVKYRFGGKKVEPYVVAGLGLAILSADLSTTYNYKNGTPEGSIPYNNSDQSASAVYPMVTVGGGLEYKLDLDSRLFLEGRFDVILSDDGSTTILPIEGGLNFRM